MGIGERNSVMTPANPRRPPAMLVDPPGKANVRQTARSLFDAGMLGASTSIVWQPGILDRMPLRISK